LNVAWRNLWKSKGRKESTGGRVTLKESFPGYDLDGNCSR